MKTKLLKKIRKRYKIVKRPLYNHSFTILDLKEKREMRLPTFDWAQGQYPQMVRYLCGLVVGEIAFSFMQDANRNKKIIRKQRREFDKLMNNNL